MRIVCLPVAGAANPYQRLMMDGLAQAGHTPISGEKGRLWPFRKSAHLRPDAYHLDWPGSYYLRRNYAASLAQLAAWRAEIAWLKRQEIPLVWTCHNLTEHEAPHPKLDLAAKQALAQVATRIRVFADSQREDVEKLYKVAGEKVIVCPEGSYEAYYPSTKTDEEARDALGLQSGGRVLLHFGTLRPYKGTDMLIEAFSRLALPDDQLIIAGPVHNPDFLQHLAGLAGQDDRIYLHPGFIAPDAVQDFFLAADVAVLPFRQITNSGSVILAMGFGLPIVAPSAGAVRERLSAQPELLYHDMHGFDMALHAALTLPNPQLTALGQANKAALAKHTWQDFGAVFNALA